MDDFFRMCTTNQVGMVVLDIDRAGSDTNALALAIHRRHAKIINGGGVFTYPSNVFLADLVEGTGNERVPKRITSSSAARSELASVLAKSQSVPVPCELFMRLYALGVNKHTFDYTPRGKEERALYIVRCKGSGKDKRPSFAHRDARIGRSLLILDTDEIKGRSPQASDLWLWQFARTTQHRPVSSSSAAAAVAR
jgi:hypothetical protein